MYINTRPLVGFCTYLLILIKYDAYRNHWLVSVHASLDSYKYGCIYRHWLVSIRDSYKVWMHLQTLLHTYLLILMKS